MLRYLTIYSALGFLAVLTLMLVFIVIYTWSVRRKETRLEDDLKEYTTELEDFLDNSKDPVPDDFFTDIEKGKHIRITMLHEYIQKHCMAKRYAHKRRIVDYAERLGLTDKIRRETGHGQLWYRADALRMLAEIGTEDDVEIFRNILQHSHFKPALIAAVAGLAKDGITDHMRTALEKIYDIKQPNRDEVLAVLAYYEDGAVDECIEMISDRDLPLQLRATVIDFVGVKRAGKAASLLEDILNSEDDSELHLHAIEALEKVGNRDSCTAILPFLKSDDFRVRLKAVNAIERLADDAYLEQAEELLSDENLYVRRNAAEAISRMGKKGMERLKSLTTSANQNISIITKMVIAEKKFRKIRWRFRYGDSIH